MYISRHKIRHDATSRYRVTYYLYYTGEYYQKGLVMFKFLVYYAIPLCVIAGFYLGMARHLALSTRNMPGELPDHRFEQIRARRRVYENIISYNTHQSVKSMPCTIKQYLIF